MNELLETVMRVLNDCSRFYPHANRNMAEKLIVRREVAVDYSVHRLVACVAWLFLGNLKAKKAGKPR